MGEAVNQTSVTGRNGASETGNATVVEGKTNVMEAVSKPPITENVMEMGDTNNESKTDITEGEHETHATESATETDHESHVMDNAAEKTSRANVMDGVQDEIHCYGQCQVRYGGPWEENAHL